MKEKIIYGIDLGTTYSAIAYVNPSGEPLCIPLSEEDDGGTIPSAVLFVGERQVYVGEEAIENSWRDGSLLIEFAKRDIGVRNGRKWPFAGWTYKPEEISALILRKIAQQVSNDGKLPPIRDVVISHPQYFHMNQKEMTKEAGELAGLNVVATITEPQAAAIAYGIDKQSEDREVSVLVFDLGGGTFDVTLMKAAQRRFEMIDSDGDSRLGGIDWDGEIVKMAKQIFKDRWGEDFDSVAQDEDHIKLRKAAQWAKEALTEKDMHRLKINVAGVLLVVEITRADFSDWCRPLVQRCLDRCERLFRRIGYDWDKVTEILMVGSSTKMPMIQEAVRRASGKDPRIDKDPKLAVAKGAAIWGHLVRHGIVDARWGQVEGQEPSGLEVREVEVSGCTAHGLGVLAKKGDRDVVRILIPKSTRTPHTAEETFYKAMDNARSVKVPVYEGDSDSSFADPNDCELIGEVIVDGLPPRGKGQPVKVTFKVDVSGRLEVEVIDVETGQKKIKQVDREVVRKASAEPGVDLETRRRHLSEIVVL